MTVTYSYADGEHLAFMEGLPAGYSGLMLKGAVINSATGIFGEIIVQEVVDPMFTVRIQHILWLSDTRLLYTNHTEGLHTLIGLKNSLRQTIKGCGAFELGPNEFLALLCNGWTGFISSTSRQELVFAEIIWPPLALLDISAGFFDPDAKNIFPGVPDVLGEPYRLFTLRMQGLFHRMLHADYSVPSHHASFIGLLTELLDAVIKEISKPVLQLPRVSSSDLNTIKAIRDYLADKTSEPTLRELSFRFAINSQKLKSMFPRIIGRTPINYWQYRRCLKVRERLLMTGEPLKAVFKEAGYNDVSTFVVGFNLYLCCNPGELRRKKWNLDAVKLSKKRRW